MSAITVAYDELDAFLIEQGAPDDAGTDRFAVRDEQSADWTLRVISRHRRALAVHEAMIAAEREHLDAFIADQRRRCDEATAHLLGLLESWHRQVLDENPKAKTLRLPAGNLVARKAPDVVEVKDAEAFMAWAEAGHDELLRVKTEPDKPKIKQLLGHDAALGILVDPETAERVPGLAWVEGDVRFTVDTEQA